MHMPSSESPSSCPLVTVITVCRNAGAALDATMASVLEQDYPHIEYLLIDGRSTDDTVVRIIRSARRFSARGRVLRWTSEPDLGIYDAMNKGTAQAQGAWICFMNAGDRFANATVVRRLMTDPEHPIAPECGVLYGNTLLHKAFGHVVMKPKSLDFLDRKMAFCHQSAFVRTELLRRQPFDLRYPLAADYDFFYRYWKSGGTFRYRDITVAVFEGEKGASSRARLQVNREYAAIRGVQTTLRWRISYALKWCTLYLKRGFYALLPTKLQQQLREANYQRLAKRRAC